MPVPGEGLHDAVLAHGVEAAVEGRLELLAPVAAARGVAPAAAVAGVPVGDVGADARSARSTGRRARGRCAPGTAGRGWPSKSRQMWMAGTLLVGLDRGLGVAGARRCLHGGHDAVPSVRFGWCSGRPRPASRQHGVEAREALLGLPAVALDPLRHEVEHLGFQVHGSSLRLPGPRHQAGVLEHLEVLGDGLQAHVVGRGQVVDRVVALGEAGHHVPTGRVGQCGEDSGELVGHGAPSSTDWLNRR